MMKFGLYKDQIHYALVAQSVECVLGKHEVTGPIPVESSNVHIYGESSADGLTRQIVALENAGSNPVSYPNTKTKGDIKMVAPIKFKNQEDLYRFSELASQEAYGIYITTAYGQLDAKSLLALFTILGKDVNVVASDCADVEKFNKFLEKYNNG